MPAERKDDGGYPAAGRMKEETDGDRAVERSPVEWLARIAELRRQGRTAEVEASLREFRRRYPDYPLDAGLMAPQ